MLEPMAVRTEEAARLLDTTPQIVVNMIHAQRLPAFKVGKTWRVPMRAIEEMCNRRAAREHAPLRSRRKSA
jgi:excisionase family DNA binding protein